MGYRCYNDNGNPVLADRYGHIVAEGSWRSPLVYVDNDGRIIVAFSGYYEGMLPNNMIYRAFVLVPIEGETEKE